MDLLKDKIPSQAYDSLVIANIKSLSGIITRTKNELAQITKLNLNVIEKICKETALLILNDKICTANHVPQWQRISTKCPPIDLITKGGIPLCGITEIVGCSGVGKTQLCLQLSLMAQLPFNEGGVNKGVVYICTEDVFPAKRLNEMARVFSLRHKINFEDNIFIEHIADFEQLKRCLCNRLPKLMNVKKIGLIVIDSIAGLFRSENVDVNYANRSQDFVFIVSKLNKFSSKFGCAVVCANQVTDNISTGKTEPCLGLAWSNLITRRFNINRYFRSPIREFEIIFASDLPNTSCKFKIAKEGLVESM